MPVEHRNQCFEALRSARLCPCVDPVAQTAHRDGPYPGRDLALGQMPVAHQPAAAILAPFVAMAVEQVCDLGLDSLRQQRSRAFAQDLGNGSAKVR